jgi:hypothetical protein
MATDSASILSIALHLLSKQVTFILALGMAFGLWCWALWAGSWISLAGAGGFTLLVFLPILFRGHSHGKDDT